ncbi:MAG: hypothetical protein ABI165_13975, partial [Bryobacteraceae bacterium]
MRRFRDIPIQRKLTLLTALTAGVALVLTCAAFLAYQYVDMREEMAAALETLADVIANNTTASL